MAPSSLPLRLAAASLGCAILAGADLPPPIRAVGAMPLVLYLPGRCWLAAVLPHGRTNGETRVLSAALSLALAVLLGLSLAALGRLGSAGWLTGLPGLCIVACAVAVAKPRSSDTEIPRRRAAPLGVMRLGAIGLAACLAVFSYREASRGADQQRPDLYTDFWIVPQQGSAPSLATAGVRNQEGRDTTYTIEVVARGRVVDRGTPFTLHPGEERRARVALPWVAYAADEPPRPHPVENGLAQWPAETAGERDRLELRLSKGDDRTAIYRRVWVALPPAVAHKPEVVAQDAPAGDLSFSGSVVNDLRAPLATVKPELAGASTPAVTDSRPGLFVDATRSVTASQAVALKLTAGPDATRSLRASAPAEAVSDLRSPRFAPASPVPADPTPLPSE